MASDNGAPGIVEGLRALAMRPLERAVAERDMARADRRYATEILERFEEAAKRVRSENDGFVPIGADVRELDQGSRDTLLKQARRAALRKPLLVGYLGSLGRYVMGEGPTFSAATGEEELDERIDAWWARFKRVNDWDSLEDEIPHRTWRDGETFIRKFVQDTDGPPENWEPSRKVLRRLASLEVSASDLEPPTLPAGMVEYRLVPPEQIRDPAGTVPFGIVTSGQDVQRVLGYLWSPSDSARETEFVPASEMHHIKIRSDSDVLRGRSLLEPLLRRNQQYEDWVEYRILLNLARSAVVWIKTIDGTPSEVTNLRDNRTVDRADPGTDRKVKAPKPLTTVHKNKAVEYEFKSPNLQARDAGEDGRRIQLNMAAATGLPEFMFTADASNSNFASTLVAESPALKEFDSWEDFYTPPFRRIWREVIREGARAGQIEGLEPGDVPEAGPHIAWPNREVRDELDHTKSQQVKHGAGILSRRTWQEESGLDPDVEAERLSQERDEDFGFTPPPAQ